MPYSILRALSFSGCDYPSITLDTGTVICMLPKGYCENDMGGFSRTALRVNRVNLPVGIDAKDHSPSMDQSKSKAK